MLDLMYQCECGCSHVPAFGRAEYDGTGAGQIIYWDCPECGTEQCLHEVYWADYQ